MATHFSILAWRIPMDRGAWWPIVHGVTKSRTQLKRLSMHAQTHMVSFSPEPGLKRPGGLRALEGGVGHKKGSMAGPGIDVEER